jgi:hypothetical protein
VSECLNYTGVDGAERKEEEEEGADLDRVNVVSLPLRRFSAEKGAISAMRGR